MGSDPELDCRRLFCSRRSLVRSSDHVTCEHLLLHLAPPLWVLDRSVFLSPPDQKTRNLTSLLFLFSQEVKSIGSSHNRSALPFAGFGPKVVTNQYNDPSGLYSSENIQNFNSTVDDIKTGAAAGDSDDKWVLLRPSPTGFRRRTSEEPLCPELWEVRLSSAGSDRVQLISCSGEKSEICTRTKKLIWIHWKIRRWFNLFMFK